MQINNKDYNLDDLNIKQLTKDQNKDINDIAKLQEKIANLTGNMSMADVSQIDQQFSMRPTVLTNSSANQQIGNLQYEIEKYQKEIELLKLKL